ncbi:MAG: hypothetical protein IJS32_05890 [Kiritimatiellae bacterium]|nr:hypothetical protein [Kiritimatiellia bacterium]
MKTIESRLRRTLKSMESRFADMERKLSDGMGEGRKAQGKKSGPGGFALDAKFPGGDNEGR